jgi:hypothetical protein
MLNRFNRYEECCRSISLEDAGLRFDENAGHPTLLADTLNRYPLFKETIDAKSVRSTSEIRAH